MTPYDEKQEILKLKDFAIFTFTEDSIWIERNSGEGCQLSKEKFEEVVKKFYEELF